MASRYLLGSTYEKSLSMMIIITFISIFIGSFSLALTTAVMNGFEKAIHEKMQNIHPQVTIYSAGSPLKTSAIDSVIKKEFPTILATSPQSIGHVIIPPCDQDEDGSPIVTLLKGINPDCEKKVSAIEKKMLHHQSLTDAVYGNHVAIGKELARRLSLSPGNTITLLYFEEPDSVHNKISTHKTRAVVGGLFDTGIDEFDTGLVLCSHNFFNQIFPNQGISQIGILCTPQTNLSELVASLKKRLGLDVYTWQELYPALVSALALEKYTMFFILLLITLVASMNIISLISMIIAQKRADIAILQAMGVSQHVIVSIFMTIGGIITGIAAALGIMAAWIASYLLERYPVIPLPQVYYISHVPAHMEWNIAITVFLVVMAVTILATWFSAQRVKSIDIARTLRFEG